MFNAQAIKSEPRARHSAGQQRVRTSISEVASERKIGAVVNFARGKTIFNDGEDSEYSYKVIEGAVRLSKVMLDGRRQIAEFALPGDMFGFEYGDAYALTAEAVTPVVVVRYHRTHIERLGDEFADIREELIAHLRHGWRSARAHLVMLGRQTAKERVAAFLISLAAHRGVKPGQRLELPMGRQDIADYLGLTIETVCRTLTEFKGSQTICIPDRHHVVISDMEALESLAEGEDEGV